MGGEITWECLGNGRFQFTMKLYRDCNGVQLNLPVTLRVHNHPSVKNIGLSLVSKSDISPRCNGSGPTISCAGADGNDAGAVEEYVFRSAPVNLPGTPPPQGWVFTFDDCCRNAAISNLVISPNASGFTLRAIMYAYNGTNTNTCFDSSPLFAQVPAVIICAGNAFTYNHNAYDPDKDSLVYIFGAPLDYLNGSNWSANNPKPIPFEPAYSVNSPFPGPGQNNSTPATLNPLTGEISFRPNYLGNFVTVVCVRSYKCGILVSEIFREIQVVVLQCGINNAPEITAPFVNTVTGLRTEFVDTVFAGELVDFSISTKDNEFLPIGLPQKVSISASGGQFGSGFTNPVSGCPNPPCATLQPAPPVIVGSNGSIRFNWQTSCNHVATENNCFVPSSTHTFVLSFQDDYCPAPAYRIATISVVVLATPLIASPSLRCTEVLANGDVKITWIPSTDPKNYFNSYHIYTSSSPNGPFIALDSIFSINQSNYTHSGANAGNNPLYYFVRTRSGCEGRILSPPSDTLSTIFLDVTDAGNGNINLKWNPIHSPNLPSTKPPFLLFKKIENNPFNPFSNSLTLTAKDLMKACRQNISYYITIPDQSGCTSKSNIDGGLISQDNPPDSPSPDSVSVVTSDNSVILSWPPSPSPDTKGYIVYQYENGQVISADTVFRPATSYSASNLQPDTKALHFAIVAFDSCNNKGNNSVIHSTIFLKYTLSSCENKVDFEWTAYEGWTPVKYILFVSRDGGPYAQQTVLSVNTLTHTIQNLIPDASYCFFIRALHSDGTKSTTSNKVCFKANVQDLPLFVYNRKATVNGNGNAYVLYYFDPASDIAFYKIQRAEYPGGSYKDIFQSAIPPGADTIGFTDLNASTSSQSYEYRLVLVDKCSNPSGVSNKGRTILLKGESADGFANQLRWNPYAEWDAGVDKYEIFRSADQGLNFTKLTQTSGDTSLIDAVSEVPDSVITFCYRIRSIESDGNKYGFRDTSYSNTICLTQQATVYIPNAFNPLSAESNFNFKGKGSYEKLAKNHEFMIFNRWGEMIFFTTDPQKSWDGTFHSRIVPSGLYVYRLTFSMPDGTRIDRKGSVMVLD